MAVFKSGLKLAEIWQSTLIVLRPTWGTLFAVAAPFTLLVDMVVSLFGPAPPTTMAEFTPRVALVLLLIPALIGAIAQLAVAHIIAVPGETPRAALTASLAVFPVYVAALLLVAAPTGLALLAFILPAIYIMARLFLAVPIAVLERPGAIEILRRSWRMTRADAWSLFLFLLLAILFGFGLSILSSGVGAALASVLTLVGLKPVGTFVAALVPATLACLFSIAIAAASTVVYLKLR